MPTALQNQLQSFKDQNKASSALRSDSKTPNLSGLQVDSDELRHLASEQFETICNGNRALKNYASLFSSKYKTFDRLMMGEKESLALDNTLREFLVHLSPFFMDNSCLAIYDWLITRFYIHKFNCVPLILSLINFFDSNSFKLLLREVLSFNDSKKFDSLRKIANSLIEFNHNIFCDLFTFQNDFLNEYLDICKIFLSVDFHLLNDDLQKKVEKRLTLDVLLISNMLNKQKLTKNALKLVCDYCSYVCESEIWILKSLPLFIVLNYKYEMPLKLKHNIMVNIGQSTLDCNTKIEVFDSFIGFSDLIEESAILAILNAVDGSTASCAINLLRKILLMIADNAEKVHMSKKLSAGLKRTINSVMISNTDTHLLEKLYHDLFRLYCLAISNQNLHQSLRKICLYLLSTNSDLFLHSLNIFMKLNNPISEYNNMFVDFLDVKDTNTKSINLEIKQYLNHSKRWKNLDYNLKLIYIVELAKMSNIIECQEIIDSLFTNSKNKTMLKEFLTILMNDMLLNSEYKDIAKEFILKNSYILNKILIKNDKSESQSRNLCMNYIDSIDNSVHDDVIVAIFPFLATIWETDKIYEFCNEYKKGCLKFTDINTYPISGKHHSILFFKNLVSDSISEDILDLIFIKSQTAAANDSNSLFEDDTLQKDFTMSIHSLLLLIDLVESKYIKNCYLSKLIHDAKTETILTDCQIDAFFETFIELEYKDILNLCKYDWYVSSIFKSLKKCKKNNDLIIQKLISLSLLFISKFSRSLNRVEEILNLFKRNLDIFINYSPIIGSIVDNKADIMLNPPKNINNIIDWIERSGNIDEASIENLVAILFMSKIHHRLNLKFENASYHLIEKFIVILLDKNVDSIPSDLLLHLRIKCSESFDKKLIRKLMSKFQDLSSDNKLTILLNSSYFMPKKYISQENLSKNLYGFEKFIKDFSDSQKYLINDFASRYNFASKSEDLKRLMEVYIASNCVNIELLYESCSILYKPATEFKSLSKLIKLLLNSEYHDASQKVYIVDLLEFFPSKKFTSFVKTNQSTFLNFLTKLSHNDFYRLCAIDKFFCKVFGSDTINELICSLFDNPLNEDSIKQLECIIKYIIMYKDDNKNEITKFLTMIFKISKSNAPVSQRLLRLFIIDYSSKLCEVFSVMLSDSDNNTCEYLLQFRIALKSIGTEELLNLNINSESIIGEVIDELQQIWRQNSLEDSLNIFCDFIQHNFAVLLNCEKVKVNKFAEMIQDCISFESRIYLITKLSISILEEDFSKPKVFIFFMTIINDFESETFSDKNEYFTSYLIEIVKQYLIKNSASFLSNTKLQNIFLRFMTRLWKSAIINLDDIISDLNIFDEFIVTCLEIFAENPDNQLISLLEFHNCLSDKLKEDFSHIIPQSCEVFMSIDFKTLM
ncbi:MAG: HEAT repeat-containing protein 1, variant 2 [Marteilia pararefringens]